MLLFRHFFPPVFVKYSHIFEIIAGQSNPITLTLIVYMFQWVFVFSVFGYLLKVMFYTKMMKNEKGGKWKNKKKKTNKINWNGGTSLVEKGLVCETCRWLVKEVNRDDCLFVCCRVRSVAVVVFCAYYIFIKLLLVLFVVLMLSRVLRRLDERSCFVLSFLLLLFRSLFC